MSSVEPDLPSPQPRPPQSQEWPLLKRLRESSHPIATVFYVGLRVAPIIIYILGSLISRDGILIFILVTLLLAADFWNVKNIAGRLMVGLRWWNDTADDGSSTFIFETADPDRYINPIDSRCFWLFLYAVPASWVLLSFFTLLRLQLFWFLLTLLAIFLAVVNTLAFSRCDKYARANNILGHVSTGLMSRLFTTISTRLNSRLFNQ